MHSYFLINYLNAENCNLFLAKYAENFNLFRGENAGNCNLLVQSMLCRHLK